MARNTLHREIKREAAACGRMKPRAIEPAYGDRSLKGECPTCGSAVPMNLDGRLRLHNRLQISLHWFSTKTPCPHGRDKE